MQNIIDFGRYIDEGHEQNVHQYKNIISPFCNENTLTKISSKGESIIDSNYGLVYDKELIEQNALVYGDHNRIPDYSGDELSNAGFLRVPFRKIPRININNRQELDSLIKSIERRDSNLELLFRGQNSEYYIDRDKQEKIALYGADDILEPSLIPSAVRRNIMMEDIMPLWNNMLHTFLDKSINSFSSYEKPLLHRELVNFKSNARFALFSMALAQHYGMPSVGLDVTDKIETALFFATHKFEKQDSGYEYVYNLHNMKEPPVIYIMSPAQRFQLNYSEIKPDYINFLRPDKQNARFLHTGWGACKNRCARQIWIALYLNPKGDFGVISEKKDLFPKEDLFAAHLSELIKLIDSKKLKSYFDDFYILK